MSKGILIFPVLDLPTINQGDDVARLTVEALTRQGEGLESGDVVVVTQKVVSKVEGRLVDPHTVKPSPFALQIANSAGKNPVETEIVLRESARIVRMAGGNLICETRHGFVCANAGVDESNMEGGLLCLLPVDPDASAQRIRAELYELADVEVAVIISDTFGRPWRMGQTNVAIGVAGMLPIASYVGQLDTAGREMRVTALCVADELAGAAELVMNKVDRVPVAIIRGYQVPQGDGRATDLVRPPEKDLFR
jgi:coenzyme F420-0:L-glutamate ligase/coenzyme F420-1:gamma-L-glutamate ligase